MFLVLGGLVKKEMVRNIKNIMAQIVYGFFRLICVTSTKKQTNATIVKAIGIFINYTSNPNNLY